MINNTKMKSGWRNFKKTMFSLTHYGVKQTINSIQEYSKKRRNYNKALCLSETPNGIVSLSNCEKIIFPQFSIPLVSIIIPVYNQFTFTYHCLESIKNTIKDIPYEIIIADDCSTDLTRDIQKISENINVVRNTTNLRFLKNCNNATKEARGTYIVFLNNDTVVQPDWLSSLLSIIEKNEKVGLVGSKLIYANGLLQEAGGIIWNDASSCNYGKSCDPNNSDFNYVKEVDYISGCSILIRASLWQQLGGFDEYFAPAYFEDTDLAFQVREAGYKVVYQPSSVVIHYEGISNGTNVTTGQKKYQEINKIKFAKKWKEELLKKQLSFGQEEFLARDRSRNKKRLLVIDQHVPFIDQDANSKNTFSNLELFAKIGYQVTFWGDDFCPHQPFTFMLQQLGINVLYGDWYKTNHVKWLKNNSCYFDYVYLNPSSIAIKYIHVIKKCSKAKIFYYGQDLSFLPKEEQKNLDKNLKHLGVFV